MALLERCSIYRKRDAIQIQALPRSELNLCEAWPHAIGMVAVMKTDAFFRGNCHAGKKILQVPVSSHVVYMHSWLIRFF